jgi:hypothetical protein
MATIEELESVASALTKIDTSISSLGDKLGALNTKTPTPERNSEGFGYLGLVLLATLLTYFNKLTPDMWMIIAGGAAAFYQAGRIAIKTASARTNGNGKNGNGNGNGTA